jgi:NitT/TauT family transport system substrate-binding protein
MKYTKRITFSSIMLSIILLVSSAAGCNPSPATKASVNIVMAPYFGTWLCTYAITSGLITSDLVDITVDQSAKFDDQMLAGNYPIGVMNTAAFAIATEKSSIKFKAMGVYLAHTGIEATEGVAVVYTKADSSISSPTDLIGKRVGVPGMQSGTASTFLGMLKNEYGINEDQMTIIDNGLPQLIEFLNKGDIDAALLLGDPSVQTHYNSNFKVLWNVDQAFKQKYGTYNPASFLVVQTDYLDNNRQIVEAVYDLLEKGREYGEAHLAELSEKYVAEYGGSAEFYQNAYHKHYSVTFDPIEGDLETGVMAIFNFVKDRGIISEMPAASDIFEKW